MQRVIKETIRDDPERVRRSAKISRKGFLSNAVNYFWKFKPIESTAEQDSRMRKAEIRS
jgi:hypothetical protein